MVLAITCGLSDPFLAVATIRPQKERASSKLILEAVKVCAKSVISEFHSKSTSISLSQPFLPVLKKKTKAILWQKKFYTFLYGFFHEMTLTFVFALNAALFQFLQALIEFYEEC